MSQEAKQVPIAEVSATTNKLEEKKKPLSIQELVEPLKSIADDIGQISELSSEEKVLVSQFFSSLLKLMQPLTPSIPIDQSALPAKIGDIVQAHIDPTGHLILQFSDGHVELKNLSEGPNRDLMMGVVVDAVPKFKSLTAQQKRKFEERIKLLSSITKEVQKISDSLSAALSPDKPSQ